MSEWLETTLAALCEKPQYGVVAKASDIPGGPLFVRQTDITSGQINWETVPYCDAPRAAVAKYGIRKGDILVSRLGNGVGNSATVKDARGAVFAGYLVRFRALSSSADPDYLGYCLQSPEWKAHVAGFRSGAAQPTLNAQQMGSFRLRVPPLPTQRAIAVVLSALDDKIAANIKLVTTADGLARAEFAAALRGVEFSALTFADVAKIGGGGTPRSKVPEFWGGEVLWLTPTDVTSLSGPYVRSTKRMISEAGLNSISSKLYPSGSIFMTSRATIGAFAIAERPMAVNQGFIVVEPKNKEERFWLFHEMRSRVPEFLEHANGATFLELSRGNFKKLPVRWPELGVIRSFGDVAGVLHDRASAALQESDRLIATRDALLPALMSGRLTVREAGAAVEGALDVIDVEPEAPATGTLW